MITVVKQYLNALYMYIYLIYYTTRIRNDRKFMIREAIKEVKAQQKQTLRKLASYEKEHQWRV